MAVGHPVVGDLMHDGDRRLDWRFDQAVPAPRLMLHCWHLRVPLAQGAVEATAPDPLGGLLEIGEVETQSPRPTLLDVRAAQRPVPDAWSSFAGGLGLGIVDDTHWDVPLPRLRRAPGRPFGPPEWDERTRKEQ